jgi:putative hydrolase of the HAD superfamily
MQHLFKQLKELKPIPTETQEDLRHVSGIKAVIFDIYGTLMISGSGDIGSTELKGQSALEAFEACELAVSPSLNPNDAGKLIISIYEDVIHQHHDKGRELGHPNPEVDIIDVWKEVIVEMESNDLLCETATDIDFQQLALCFEIKNNPVFPMPNMIKTLQWLCDHNYQLGIISNAQFFTPLLLDYFSVEDNGCLKLFHPDLQIYSHRLRRAKPDIFLYECMARQLKIQQLSPPQCLYVGNDMLNDIMPAKRAGFKTVLFAGDTRSLQLRTQHPKVQGVQPDRIINDLSQLSPILEG